MLITRQVIANSYEVAVKQSHPPNPKVISPGRKAGTATK